jgi:microsomal epoxide hydrolase
VRQSLRVPLEASIALLSYSYPREFWKQTVYQTDKPVLYVVSERFRGQAQNFKKHRPEARIEIFEHAGHALFVDEAGRFNKLLDEFIRGEGRE